MARFHVDAKLTKDDLDTMQWCLTDCLSRLGPSLEREAVLSLQRYVEHLQGQGPSL